MFKLTAQNPNSAAQELRVTSGTHFESGSASHTNVVSKSACSFQADDSTFCGGPERPFIKRKIFFGLIKKEDRDRDSEMNSNDGETKHFCTYSTQFLSEHSDWTKGCILLFLRLRKVLY